MTQLSEPPDFPVPKTGWPIDLTRGVVQVLDVQGRPLGTGFLVGERFVVTCAHLLTRGGSWSIRRLTRSGCGSRV